MERGTGSKRQVVLCQAQWPHSRTQISFLKGTPSTDLQNTLLHPLEMSQTGLQRPEQRWTTAVNLLCSKVLMKELQLPSSLPLALENPSQFPPLFFLKRQWLRVHSAHETSDQWLLAVAIVCLSPPISRQCILGSCWDLRKMSLPDTVLFWFRSQIAWLSFYIDNKEMVAFPKLYSVRLFYLRGEGDWSFCASCSTLDPDVCIWLTWPPSFRWGG